MSTLNIPEGYQRVMPYLIVKDATRFFDFMQKVFGATQKMKVMRDEHTIMHAELQIGDSTVMYSEATETYSVQNAGLFVYVADADETYQKALAEGAESIMPPANQDYGCSGGIKDPAGNSWWITSWSVES